MFGRTNIRPVKNGLKAVLRSFPVKPWVRPEYRCVFFVQGKARKVLVAEQTQKSSVRRITKSKKGTDSRRDTERTAWVELGKARKVLTAQQTQKEQRAQN